MLYHLQAWDAVDIFCAPNGKIISFMQYFAIVERKVVLSAEDDGTTWFEAPGSDK